MNKFNILLIIIALSTILLVYLIMFPIIIYQKDNVCLPKNSMNLQKNDIFCFSYFIKVNNKNHYEIILINNERWTFSYPLLPVKSLKTNDTLARAQCNCRYTHLPWHRKTHSVVQYTFGSTNRPTMQIWK